MKSIRTLIISALTAMVVVTVFSFPAPVSAVGTETRLHYNSTGQAFAPSVYGNNVVWADTRNGVGNNDIILYNLDSGDEKQITSDPSDQVNPKTYQNLVVWEDYRTPLSGIYLYDITTGSEVRVSDGSSSQTYPAIWGNRIVWADMRSGFSNIYINGTVPGSETPLSPWPSNQMYPAIFGDLVVWLDDRNGAFNIYLFNLSSSQETQITSDPSGELSPAIYGNRIVWMDGRTANAEIFINGTDPGLEYSLTPGSAAMTMYPAIHGSKVIWYQNNLTSGHWDIMMNDTSISGSLIPVVLDAAMSIDTPSSLLTDPSYGDRVVWQDDRPGYNSVSLYTSDPGTPSACPVAGFTSDFTGGSAPVSVHFTDATPPLVTHSYWEFGDGSSAMDPSPVIHTYTANNPYTVTHIVSNPWCRNETIIPNFIIVGAPVASFTASPTSEIVPATIHFTDTSAGNPDTWAWDFGDGGTSAVQNPTHQYTIPGSYSVSLTASNTFGSNTRTRTNYIMALHGANELANTTIDGLSVSNCSGPQTITVDSSIISASLTPNSLVLELQPPADRGFANITIYALDGTGFTTVGPIINGHVTGVHLQTREIVPAGFSSTGPVSVNYSIDLPLYPCDATLNTKIWEGTIPEDRDKFQRIAIGSSFAHWLGTLYTTKITKTNFPATGTARLHMSADSAWVAGMGGRNQIYIERITDDGLFGEVLRTQYLSHDTLQNLDLFEADSPRGLSTFGLSSLSGSGNPLQLITLSVTSHANQPAQAESDSDSSTGGGAAAGNIVVPTSIPTTLQTPMPADPGKSAKVYTNANGLVTQATRLPSTNGRATITIGEGVVAKNAGGNPLTEITLKALPAENLPAFPSEKAFTFAGMAYDLGPDGATFSPPVALTFTLPQAQWGQDYAVRSFDTKSGTWQDLPTSFDAVTGSVTVEVSHLCIFALFAQPRAPPVTPAATPLPLPSSPQVKAQPPATAVSIFTSMLSWVTDLVVNHAIIPVVIAILAIVGYLVSQGRIPGSGR